MIFALEGSQASTWTMRPISVILPPSMLETLHVHISDVLTHVEPTTETGRACRISSSGDAKRKYHANKVNLHASHNVDMPSKLVELNIARMQCIAVFANMQTKNASPWC